MKHYAGDPYWTSARFNSHCHGCGGTIKAGESIFYFPRGKQVFCSGTDCGKKESGSFTAAAFDEEVYNYGYGN
jgi:hypothetical protein